MQETQEQEELALAVYHALRDRGGFSSEEELRVAAGMEAAQVERGRRRLERLGLIEVKDGQIVPVEPDAALVRTMLAHRAGVMEQARRDAEVHDVWASLLTVYRPAAGRDASQVEVEYLTERRRKDRALHALNEMTMRFSDSMHPGPPPVQMLAGSLREDAKLIDRGVQVRAIYPHALLQNAKYARYLHDLSELGAEVRLLGHAPCDLLIFDRTFASLPADPADRDGGAILMIRGSALAASYLAFYEDFWLRAVPYEKAAGNGPPSGAELTPQERTVIRLMAGGLTDDQIARKMGVHRRTVQRAVSKLLERLHASSRFEAGLKLAQDPEYARALRSAVPEKAPGPP
jgi:DNA-binding CsgD family transcriptional regulator